MPELGGQHEARREALIPGFASREIQLPEALSFIFVRSSPGLYHLNLDAIFLKFLLVPAPDFNAMKVALRTQQALTTAWATAAAAQWRLVR
jgi:hypothetical protein